jgi:CTP synthase (UTP-ammonia lyase)
VEIARDVLGYRDADHEETNPRAERLVVTALACSLAGQRHRVTVRPGTRAAALYGVPAAEEEFFCSYGVNPAWVGRLEGAGLAVTGRSDDGEIRIVELPAHSFFLATLFLPQARSSAVVPHPLVAGFAAAAAAAAERRSGSR